MASAKKSSRIMVLTDAELVDAEGNKRKVKNDWTFGKQLGQPGQFGVAHLVQNKKTKELAACKIIAKSKFAQVENKETMYEDMRNEIKMMREIKHKNVILFLDVYENKKNLYIVMEVCTGGELFDRIQDAGSLTEKETSKIMFEILSALESMHDKKIAHCDLKPDNFLFKDKTKSSVVKVIDFGMAKSVERGKYLKQLCGTPYYTAPEVCGKSRNYNTGADVWSMGVVMFVMLFGFPPFYVNPGYDTRKEAEAIYALIQKGFDAKTKPGYGPYFPEDIECSEDAKDLIGSMLQTDRVKRPTITECLAHKWFKSASDKPLNHMVLQSLGKFHNTTKFKQATLSIFKTMGNMLNASTVDDLRDSFKKMDTNGDGQVSYEEFEVQMIKCGHKKDEIQEMFKNVDVDDDHSISYEELMMTVTNEMLSSRDERLWEAFCEMDEDDDGVLTAKELSDAMSKHGVNMTESAKELISQADTDGDGTVDWEEFMKALSS